ADGRADRPQIPGTIARGKLVLDDHYSLGFTREKSAKGTSVVPGDSPDVHFYNDFPESVTVDEAFIRRGQQVFNITCANCHGRDGMGNGPVNLRATLNGSMATGWVKPTDLLGDPIRERPNGHIYNTINNGIRNMAAHGHQIEPKDR
ncbi:MAG TPA: cytochrome c, partial [Tepidisphaeraceae bacterium]|nr:cytochrome c [Tepidisphaeraceae bacterium]